jgi:hypothetical protein
VNIEDSSLWREVTTITQSGPKPINYTWTCQIHANGVNYTPMKVVSVDNITDYENNYGDEIFVEISILGGMYANNIYPFKEDLEITMFRKPLLEAGDAADTDSMIQTERYRANLIDTGNPVVEANARNTPTKDALDLTNLYTVKFQLVNKALEQLRAIGSGNIYRNGDVGTIIKNLLSTDSQIVQTEGLRMPKGVNMEPGTNPTVWDHVVIPQGVPLVKIPQYIHEKCRGVYSAGLGYYYQGDYWYVYPCYDTTRWNSAPRNVTVINIPKNKLDGIERTYRKNGNNLVILATGEVRFRDDSEVQQLNHGNGSRFAIADNFMNNFAVVKNNKATVSRGSNNTEFISNARKTGLNYVKTSSNEITSNSYLEYSATARRLGSFLSFVWQNGLPSLLFPGMMVRVMYLDNDTVKTVDGVLLKVHSYSQMRGQGLTASRHMTETVVSVFVNRIQSS